MRVASFVAVLPALLFGSSASAQLTFDEIASAFSGGVGPILTVAKPAIDENGRVVFDGRNLIGERKLFVGDGGAITTINLNAGGYSDVTSLQINAGNHIVWTSRRVTGAGTMIGAYRTDALGSFSSILREGPEIYDPLTPSVNDNVALSPNGTVAYSTIRNGDGAIYRHFVGGAITVLREGTGTFYNHQRLDVNDAGEVVIQMEYFDPTLGLGRGLLIFDAFNQSTSQINTAVEKMGFGATMVPNMNASGDVAFSLNSNLTMTFYDPPDDAGGNVVAVVTLTPGVYISTPTAFGEPPVFTQVADTLSGFDSFGSEVQLNDNGIVAFSAVRTGGGTGLYFGPNAATDKILEPGDAIDGQFVSNVSMGELNDANQLVILTVDVGTLDGRVWRVNNVPEPGVTMMLVSGLFGLVGLVGLFEMAGRRKP